MALSCSGTSRLYRLVDGRNSSDTLPFSFVHGLLSRQWLNEYATASSARLTRQHSIKKVVEARFSL